MSDTQIPDDGKPVTEAQVKAILRDRARLFKNGEGWGEYFRDKWLTPQNLGWICALAFMVYGEWRDMRTGVAGAIEAARKATEAQAQLLTEIGTLSKAVDTQQQAVEAQHAVIEAQRSVFATSQNLVALEERVRQSVTRREFLEFQRSVLPALQRIEKSVDK
jgi:hypothetical protein